MSGARFQARRVTHIEWVIRDTTYDPDDPRSVVACVTEADSDEYEVIWVRELPLRRWYESVTAVLEDVTAFTSRHTKPIHIPHLPPRTEAAAVRAI